MKKLNNHGLSWLCMLLCIVMLAACGRKGDPSPDFSSLTFALRGVSVTQDAGGLLVQGSVSGALENVESLVLELQPLDENCADCPFVPQERVRMEADKAWESYDSETFSFHCLPVNAASGYRWRLTVHNYTAGIAPQISPVGVVHMNSDDALHEVLTAPDVQE